jgi:hypothetical protein
MRDEPTYTCPVCGYSGLRELPWSGSAPSDEICASCGIHFGYDDVAGGDEARRLAVYSEWRDRWVADGYPWFSRATSTPDGWDAEAQHRQVSD